MPGKVLAIDDQPEVLKLLTDLLKGHGRETDGYQDGDQALQALESSSQEVDLVVLDLIMPVMDGFEFVYELRKVKAWRTIPITVVTSKDITDEDRARLNGYAEKILQKGAYDRDELLEQLREVVIGCVERA